MKTVRDLQKKLIKLDHLLTFNKKDIKYKFIREGLEIMTEMGSSVIALIFIIAIGAIEGWNTLFLFVPIYVFQVLIVELIKLTFRRNRPKSYTRTNFFGLRSTSGSFPSGHTSNMFCLSYLLCNHYQTNLFITTVIFLIAANIGLSRILLGKHYLIDVLAGALIGLSLTIIGTYAWIYLYSNTTLIPTILI